MSSEVKNGRWSGDRVPGNDSAGQQGRPELNELPCMSGTSFILCIRISLYPYSIYMINGTITPTRFYLVSTGPFSVFQFYIGRFIDRIDADNRSLETLVSSAPRRVIAVKMASLLTAELPFSALEHHLS